MDPAGVVGYSRQLQRRDRVVPLVTKLPEVAGKVGHPKCKPDALQGDLAYDSEPHREGLRQIGIEPVLPEKGIDEESGLGKLAGRWSGRWPGSTRTAGFGSAMSVGRTSIRRLTLACIKICASALFAWFC